MDYWHIHLLQALFWLSLALLAYAFAGYHLLMWLWARLRGGAIPGGEGIPTNELPQLSVVLVVYNEAQRVVERLENLLAGDYPPERLEIWVVSDGSTDDTVAKVQEWALTKSAQSRIQVLAQPERGGKSACLNAGIARCSGEIVALADARQTYAPDTLRRLAVAFIRCPQAGAVSGSLEIAATGAGTAGGVDIYWRMEKRLRHSEAVIDSAIGCTGAVYAIRRELYQPTTVDTLVEDVVIPMRIAQQAPGWRVLFEPRALAFDPQQLAPEREKRRKQRTLAGNFQMLARYPQWLLPWRNRLWWQLISHKYLRLAGPLLMGTMLVTSALLVVTVPPALPLLWLLYAALLGGQVVFYTLAVAGMFLPRLRSRVLSLPAGFVFLNLQVLDGLRYLLGRKQAGW